ncbi:MAG: response regulator transcription factor [Gemmatimonadota bacterium]|nr:response regulator transcription factor [Gemmatimonadota bacterium]
MISIVVADDHHLVRQSIVTLLDQAEDVKVVGEASNGHEALLLIRRERPDVALVDVAMPQLNGLETAYRTRALDVDTRVIILSMYSDAIIVRRALENGAAGYLLKSAEAGELLDAIRTVASDQGFVPSELARTVSTSNHGGVSVPGSSNVLDRLTSREREIMQLIAEGNTNRSIAEMLTINIKTVEKHRASLMRKLGARSIPDLIQAALKLRLVFLEKMSP